MTYRKFSDIIIKLLQKNRQTASLMMNRSSSEVIATDAMNPEKSLKKRKKYLTKLGKCCNIEKHVWRGIEAVITRRS